MSFAQELQRKRDSKIVELAEQFIETIKPELIDAAEKGCSSYDFKIEASSNEEIQKMKIYTSPAFVEYLNKLLDGVKATNIFFPEYERYNYLKFTW